MSLDCTQKQGSPGTQALSFNWGAMFRCGHPTLELIDDLLDQFFDD